MISDKMLQENIELHRHGYGGGGYKWAGRLNALIDNSHINSVLDFGCGEGTLAPKLNCKVYEYDPAIPGKDTFPRKQPDSSGKQYDLVIATDVLEHIEPEYLHEVLSTISTYGEWAFLSIATRPSNKYLSDGRNCHLILEDGDWWRAELEQFFTKVFPEQPMRKNEVVFLCQT